MSQLRVAPLTGSRVFSVVYSDIRQPEEPPWSDCCDSTAGRLMPPLRTHLSFHAADPHQLVQDQQSPMDSVITVHPLFLGHRLIETLLSFLIRLLKQDR